MMRIYTMPQGSEPWHVMHKGRPSASNFPRILCAAAVHRLLRQHDGTGHVEEVSRHRRPAKAAKELAKRMALDQAWHYRVEETYELSKGRHDFIDELIASLRDELFPPNSEHFTNRHVEWGQETEANARRWYSLDQSCEVLQVGFITTEDGRLGCSPDGCRLGSCHDAGAQEVQVGDELLWISRGLELKCPSLKVHLGYLREGILPLKYTGQVHGGLVVTGLPQWDFLSYAPARDIPPFLKTIEPDAYTRRLKEATEEFLGEYEEALKKLGIAPPWAA